jgi:hypothetical protein
VCTVSSATGLLDHADNVTQGGCTHCQQESEECDVCRVPITLTATPGVGGREVLRTKVTGERDEKRRNG